MLAEVQAAVSQGGDITPDALTHMPYIKAVLKETFRWVELIFRHSPLLRPVPLHPSQQTVVNFPRG